MTRSLAAQLDAARERAIAYLKNLHFVPWRRVSMRSPRRGIGRSPLTHLPDEESMTVTRQSGIPASHSIVDLLVLLQVEGNTRNVTRPHWATGLPSKNCSTRSGSLAIANGSGGAVPPLRHRLIPPFHFAKVCNVQEPANT